jgi:hypothetical protein
MFVRYFVELPIPQEQVETALAHDPRSWLPGLARDAHRRGDALLAEVGFGEAIRIKREVNIQLGPPIRSSSKTVFPLRWEAAAHPKLFPSLDADLEVAPLGPERTQLAISARYVPPFRAFGRALDRAVLSRIAEATVKDFLDQVALTLMPPTTAQVGAGSGNPAISDLPRGSPR